MFEKEAEEYTRKNWDKNVTELKNDITYQYVKGSPHFYDSAINQAFQKGADLGYNKANEWHYPSKGELPKDESEYLVIFESDGTKYTGLEIYYPDTEEWSTICNIIAWKEIVLPELKEEV